MRAAEVAEPDGVRVDGVQRRERVDEAEPAGPDLVVGPPVEIGLGPDDPSRLGDFRATMPSLDEASRLVGRNARPDEIAAVVAFALSPDASWLNGMDVRLDGGLTALRTRPT